MLDCGALKILHKFKFSLFWIAYHHYQKWIFLKNIFFFTLGYFMCLLSLKRKKITNLIGRLFLYVLLPIQNRTHVFNLKKSRIKTRDNTVYGAVQLGILARYLSVLDSWFNIFIPKFTLKSTLHLIIS